jgi:two-component system nitrogen regulation response regulator NtrX
VLIVDDDDDIREALAMVLNDEGFPTEVACDGVMALEHLKSHDAPLLILLDLMMPRLDGEEVLERIKKDPRLAQVPVVVLSGDILARERVDQLHADDFVLKPVELDHLLAVVRRHASRQSAAKQ